MTTAFADHPNHEPARASAHTTGTVRERAPVQAVIALAHMTPGQTAIVETFSPAVAGRARALRLQPGQTVRCVAAGTTGATVELRADDQVTIVDELASGILVRPLEDSGAHDADCEAAIPVHDERR